VSLERNVKLEGIAKFAKEVGLEPSQFILQAREKAREEEREADSTRFSKPLIGDAKTPLDILKRTLSVRSVLSTHSSFAERMEALRNVNAADLKLAEIGRGSFGTVYEIPGTEWCLKKTLTSPETMWLEFLRGQKTSEDVNQKARKAILRTGEFDDALMPRVPDYLCSYGTKDEESTKGWFKRNAHMFPDENGGKKPGPVICLERILPLPKIIRESLIRHYFEPEKQEEALSDPRNKHCLCRPYLGSTSQAAKENNPDKWERERECLQNFPLYLDYLEELDMDPFTIARDMALGLAAGHWRARIDMLDIEYVIGSRPHEQPTELKSISTEDAKALKNKETSRARDMSALPTQTPPGPLSFRNRAIQLWMIDFNKVSEFDTAVNSERSLKKNVAQLVANTRAVDGPYYPRVLAENEWQWSLWVEFAKTYIGASEALLAEDFETTDHGYHLSDAKKALFMGRPKLVIKEWMKAECFENGVSGKDFRKKLERDGWPLP
jgi:hypothetical protein